MKMEVSDRTAMLAIFMNHWVAFSIIMVLWTLIGATRPPFLLWLILGFVPMTYHWIRRRTEKEVWFWGKHALVLAVVIAAVICFGKIASMGWVTKLVYQAAAVIYTVICGIISIQLGLSEEKRTEESIPPPAAVGLIAMALLVTRKLGQNDLDIWFVVLVFGYLGCYFIQYYMKNYMQFVSSNRSGDAALDHDIFMVGIGTVSKYVGCALAALLLVFNIDWLGKILEKVRQFFVWLFHLLPTYAEEQVTLPPAEHANLTQGVLEQIEESEPWWGFVLLEKILMTIMPFVLLAVVAYLVYQGIKALHQRFLDRIGDKKADLDEADVSDIRESFVKKKQQREKKQIRIFKTPSERIRQLYRDYISANRQVIAEQKGQNALEALTARQCGSYLKKEQLADIYEKAKYSSQECDKEDIKRIRRIIKGD